MASRRSRSSKVLWIALPITSVFCLLCIFVILWNETSLFGNDSIFKPLSDCPAPPDPVPEDAHWSEVVPDSTWNTLDSANYVEKLEAIAIDSQDRMYVAGPFNQIGDMQAEGIARLDLKDLTWTNLGSGLLSNSEILSVNFLQFDAQDRLYAAGNFSMAGDQIANGIAMWDGQAWRALGSGLMNGRVSDFTLAGDRKLYASGTFSQVGGQKTNGIAFWDGQEWQDPGGMSQKLADLLHAVPREVRAIAYDPAGKLLYASGTIYRDDSFRGFLAVWKDGSQAWNLIAELPDYAAPKRIMMTPRGSLVAGGETGFRLDSFGNMVYSGSSSFPAASYGIAFYENGKWKGLKSGLTLMGGNKRYQDAHGYSPVDPVFVTEMAFDQTGQLYIIGRFISVDNKCMYGIARWDGSEWSALGSGLASAGFLGPARNLAFDSKGNLYVAGNFPMAGGKPIRNLARWAP